MPQQKTGDVEQSLSTARKRKQSPSQPPTECSSHSPAGFLQSTIPEHFSSAAVKAEEPEAKRSKTASRASTPTRKDKPEPLTQATMLNFSSKQPAVIDLTSSPSPRAESGQKSFQVNNKYPVSAAAKPPPFQPHAGARKIVVKNLKKTTKSDTEAYFNSTWRSLETALGAIFRHEKIPTSMEELYRGVENICRADKAPTLYDNLRDYCDNYVGTKLKPRIAEHAGDSDISVVQVMESAWSQWGEQLSTIRSIFLYLDRSYVFSSPRLKSIEDMGVGIFRKHIASDPELEPKLLRGIFELFQQDRQSRGEDSMNVSILTSCVRMISSLRLYSSDFEPRFFDVSREYFMVLAEQESATRNLAGYVKECVFQRKQEFALCDKYNLDVSTKRQLIAVVEDEMIRKMIPSLTNKERVRELLERRDFTSLETLYWLLDRVDTAGQLLKRAWEAYIIAEGTKIVVDREKEAEMVPRLLDFKSTLDSMWTGPFKKNDVIGYALRESFATFINERRPEQASANNSKPAEMIAKYVDLLLRSGTKGLPAVIGREDANGNEISGDDDAQLAYRLELVLDLFRFIQGKDVFEAFYKKDLARRLLMGRSASFDAERLMLTKLKTECGAGFTHNLEGMFKDMDLSKESVASFKNSKAGVDKSKGVDLYVNVLSQSAWPTYPEIPVNIPPDLGNYLEAFSQFYVSKHSGRKLTWRHSLSHCILKADFPKGRKELVLSAFQAVVLLLFNDAGSSGILSYPEIQDASGLTDAELTRTLQSMACGKLRVLTKSPKGRDVNKTDKFQVNHGFQDAKFRVKINQIQLKETKQENKETHERVAQDRQYETQAAIIRIMKARKTIRHVELVQQTIEQTKNRGMLDVADIKRNIERLIDKDYMDRQGDSDVYVYVA